MAAPALTSSTSPSLDGATPDQNIDPREAAHYAALAHSWWDSQGPFWPLHGLNRLRVQYLRRELAGAFSRSLTEPRPLDGISILDVGCGGGILSESMAREGADVHGIDVVEKNISVARHHARESGVPVHYETASAATLAGRSRTYDVILNMEVVEHVPDVPTFVHDCAGLLTPGGIMVLATINRTFLAWLLAIVGAEYVLGWLPRGTHRWDRFVTPAEVQRMLRTTGLDIKAMTGVKVNPLTRRFSLTRVTAVNYMLLARKDRSGAANLGTGQGW